MRESTSPTCTRASTRSAATRRARAQTLLAGLGFDEEAQARLGRALLRRLAHAPEPRARAHVPLGPAAPGRAHQPPRPRRRALARGLAQGICRRGDPHHPRPRVPRCGGRRHRARREPAPQRIRGQLQRLRDAARGAPRAAAVGLREAAAHRRAPRGLHHALPRQGHQGAPGAEPHPRAGKLERIAAAHVDSPFSFAFERRRRSRASSSASRTRRSATAARPCSPASSGACCRATRSASSAPTARASRRCSSRSSGPAARGRGDAASRAGAAHRLLRAAPGRPTAPRRVGALAPRSARAGGARAGVARFPRRLRLPRRPGDAEGGELLGRREGAPRAGAHRLAAAQPAAASTSPPTTSTSRCARRSPRRSRISRARSSWSRTIGTCFPRRPTSGCWWPTGSSRLSRATSTTTRSGRGNTTRVARGARPARRPSVNRKEERR